MGDWFRRVMAGRYGVDQLTWVLLIAALLLSMLARLLKFPLFAVLSWVLLIYGYFRIFSRNIPARQRENQSMMRFWYKIKYKKDRTPRAKKNHKEYRYFSCPNCKQKLRVPRGKGKISITCPKCNKSFIKKS